MNSNAIKCLVGNNGVIDFSLPRICPMTSDTPAKPVVIDADDVLNTEVRKGLIEEEVVLTPKKGRGKRAPVLETEVRRSPRLKPLYNESKPLSCTNRRCSSYSPPTMSAKVLKNLGVQLCEIDPELGTEENLRKGGKRKPIAKRRKAANSKVQDPISGDEKNQDDRDQKDRRAGKDC